MSTIPIIPMHDDVAMPVGQIGENAQKTLYKMNQARERLSRMRWDPCTLINLYPMAMQPSGYVYDSVLRQVLPAPLADDGGLWLAREADGLKIPYSMHVQNTYYLDRLQKEDEGQDVQEILPLQLMQGIVDQQNGTTGGGGRVRGGMFCILGGPLDPFADWNAPAYLGTSSTALTVRDAFNSAFSLMIRCMEALYQEAEQHAAEKHVHMGRRITNEHRIAARYMKLVGILANEPEWISKKRPRATVIPVCRACGVEGKPDACICVCNEVLDPALAYQRKLIDEFSDGGLKALRRLSREELDGLGLKHIETFDEYTKRKRSDIEREEKQERKARKET